MPSSRCKDMIQTTSRYRAQPSPKIHRALFNKMIFQGEDFIFRMRRDFCVQCGFQFFRPAPSVPTSFPRFIFHSCFCVFIRRRKAFHSSFSSTRRRSLISPQAHTEYQPYQLPRWEFAHGSPGLPHLRKGMQAERVPVNGGTARGVGNKHSSSPEETAPGGRGSHRSLVQYRNSKYTGSNWNRVTVNIHRPLRECMVTSISFACCVRPVC